MARLRSTSIGSGAENEKALEKQWWDEAEVFALAQRKRI